MKFLWITIYVKNMDESVAFYSDMLGLKTLNRFPAGPGTQIAFMGNGTDNETLIELMADSSKDSVHYSEFISVGFAVDSVDTMLNTVKDNGICVHSGPFDTPSYKFFGILDPNGLHLQFFQKK